MCDRTTGGCCAGVLRCGAAEERVNEAQDERVIKAQDTKPKAVGKSHEDKAPFNALEGPHRQAKWSAQGRTVGGWRTGVLRRKAVEERVDKAQGGPEVVGGVDGGENPSSCRTRLSRTQETLVPLGTV